MIVMRLKKDVRQKLMAVLDRMLMAEKWGALQIDIIDFAGFLFWTCDEKVSRFTAGDAPLLWKLKTGERSPRWMQNGECSISPIYLHHLGWLKNGEQKMCLAWPHVSPPRFDLF